MVFHSMWDFFLLSFTIIAREYFDTRNIKLFSWRISKHTEKPKKEKEGSF